MEAAQSWIRYILMGSQRYMQQETDLCRALLAARPDLSLEDAIKFKWKAREREIQRWALKHAKNGLSLPQEDVNVVVATSSVPGAGQGVFCKQPTSKGTLICVHPGSIHHAESVANAVKYQRGDLFHRVFVQDRDHAVQLFDGTVLDAGQASLEEWTPHPFAVAHKCNHPPAGQAPNVFKCPFYWKPNPPVNVLAPVFPDPLPDPALQQPEGNVELLVNSLPPNIRQSFQRLGDYLSPREWIKSAKVDVQGQTDDQPVRGLAFVTTRDLHAGEELFVNYRFNPRLSRPEWYIPVDEKEDNARWA